MKWTFKMALTLLFSMMITNSLMIILSKSSILMMVMVITQTFLVCVAIKYLMNISWFSFVLFLVFVGGLLVLFIYIISLTPNTQFSNNNLTVIIASIVFSMSLGLNLIIFNSMLFQNLKFSNLSNHYLLVKLYSNPSIWMTFMAMTYLLLVLVIVVYVILTDRSSMKSLLIKN